MTKGIIRVMVAVIVAASLGACATQDNTLSHKDVQKPEGVQQVYTAIGPTFVDCAVSHCPTRTTKTIGGSAEPVQEVAAIASQLDVQGARIEASGAEVAVTAGAAESTGKEHVIGAAVVHFAWNSAVLTAVEMKKLDKLAPLMKSATRIRVLGRTDATGAGPANDRLANERALSVMLHLKDLLATVDTGKVDRSGKGLCCYVAPNDSKTGRHLNRRAEVEIYGSDSTKNDGHN